MTAFFSSNKKVLIPLGLVIALIILSMVIIGVSPTSYNPLTQVLFDIMLTATSIWTGDALSKTLAEKRATEKWIPAAEMVCNELLTMSATTERMCRKQSQTNQSLEVGLPNTIQDMPLPAKQLMNMRCGYCSENLEYLKNHIENSYRNWDIFISNNCDEKDCDEIHKRLNERRDTLFAAIERDFPQAPAEKAL
jgi:hypothetical protein